MIVPAPFPLSLQAAIDSAAPGAVIDVTGGPVYGPVTISRPLTLKGAHIAAPLQGVSIIGCHVYGMRKTAICAQHVSGFHIDLNTIEDCAYAGITVFSGRTGSVDDNAIRRIGFALAASALPGSGNSYGIEIDDQGLPASADVVVSNNLVEDVPNWHGLNTHGGQRITFSHNTVRRCRRGLFITSSPASGAHATGIVVAGNQILSPSPLTNPTTPVTLYQVVGATFTDNIITGWGNGKTDPGKPWYDYLGESTGLVDGGGNVVTP